MENERLERVKRNMSDQGLTQMIITDPMSIYYICGHFIDPGERLLALFLRVNGDDFLLVNKLFTLDGEIGLPVQWYDDTQDGTVLLSAQTTRTAALGIDKNMPARFLLRLMAQNAAASYLNASSCVDQARAVKDDAEINLMKKASALNDRAMDALFTFVKPGITELELRDRLISIYQTHGTDGVSFDPLIGFGPNAAIGHHLPDSTPLHAGDCVLLDIGCKKDGYCADMTRTFFCGEPSARLQEIYQLVKAANEAARRMIRPGVLFCDIDAAARTIITAGGYGAYFTHRLGHFIGLEVHEDGDVSASNPTQAQPGMVFSIEPGIYLPGEGGVRIEDLVLVTETGCETLNSVPRELRII